MDSLVVGFSKIDITPTIGIELCGYGYHLKRFSSAVLDQLFATAVFIRQSNDSFLLINCDLIGISKSGLSIIENSLTKKLHLPRKDIMLSCTHTHTGPATGTLYGCGEIDNEYLKNLYNLIIYAGISAYKGATKVHKIYSFKQPIETFSINRSIEKGRVDDSIRGILIEFYKKRPLALINHGCHPTALGINDCISADYPGYVVSELDKKGIDTVYINGFCGDIKPAKIGSYTDVIHAGKKILQSFENIECNLHPLDNFQIASTGFDARLNLQTLTVHDIEIYRNEYASLGEMHIKPADAWRSAYFSKINKSSVLKDTVHIRFFRLGSVIFAGYSGEMVISLSDIINNQFTDKMVIHTGNLFDTRRYISNDFHLEIKSYEAHDSNFAYNTQPITKGDCERMVTDTCCRAKKEL